MTVPFRSRSIAVSPSTGLRALLLFSVAVAAIWLMTAQAAHAGNPPRAPEPVVPTTPATGGGSIVVPEDTSGAGKTETPTRTGITPPGVSPPCLEAARAAATARAAVLRAAIDERTPQPPSVMQTTCFNEAAGVAATQGGNVFSGDFMSDIEPIVGSALGSFYSNFDSSIASFFSDILGGGSAADAAGGIIGGIIGALTGGAFGADAATLRAPYDCEGMSDIWDAVLARGAKPVAIPDLRALVNGTAPSGGGENFMKSFNASKQKGVFGNAKTALDALPRAQVPSFNGREGLCEVLSTIGGASVQGCD